MSVIAAAVVTIGSGIIPCSLSKDTPDNAFIQVTEVRDLSVKDVIQTLLDERCPTAEKVTKWSCKFIVKGDPSTKACYVEATAGYFFVTNDIVGNTNIVYTRLD